MLIVSGSPRKHGNSDLLCDEFEKGAVSAGNSVKKIFIQEKNIKFCKNFVIIMHDEVASSARHLLAEFTKKDLEDECFKNCEALDSKASEIIQLEQKLIYLKSRLSRFTKEKNGAAPVKSKSTTIQLNPKELQDQITSLEQRIIQRQTQCDNLAKQVQYFRQMKKLNAPKTFDEMVEICNDLFCNRSVPPLINQLRATSAILQNNYSGAEGPLRSMIEKIGQKVSLSESFRRKKDIREREAKIEELRSNLIQLQKRYDKMEVYHKQMYEAYQKNAVKNSKKSEKVSELQRRKETKQIESMQTSELEIKAESIQREIFELQKQKQGLIEKNKHQKIILQNEVRSEYQQLQNDVQQLEIECKRIDKENKKIEEEYKHTQTDLSISKKRRDEAEKKFRSLQKEYKEINEAFNKFMETTEIDPFNDPNFVEFLSAMTQKNYLPERVKNMNDKITKIEKQIKEITQSIENSKKEQDEITQRIESKRIYVSNLDQQISSISSNLKNKTTNDQQIEKPAFTEGAENANFADEEIQAAGDDKNAIVIVFRDFQISPSFIGQKSSQIFLVVDFLEHQSLMTTPVDPRSGSFNESICFVCQNDFILKEYIEKSAVPFQLCRQTEKDVTKTGQSELFLYPFVNPGIKKFTSSTKIWNDEGKTVAKLVFEAAILKDLP